MSDTKKFTPAETQHLIALNNAARLAQAELNRFVEFLRLQHDAAAEHWLLRDIAVGFEPMADESTA